MLYDDLQKAIGRTIRNARLEKGLTLDELGKQVGITKATLCKYEAGTINKIAPDRLEKLSQILGVPIAQVASTYYESDRAFSDRTQKMQAAKDLLLQCWGQNALAMIETFSILTVEGQKKAVVYMEDLAGNARYNQVAQELKADRERDT